MTSSIENPFMPSLLALQKESDRGCVIVAAALLEDKLESSIKKMLLPKADKKDELFSDSGPINSFSSKIDLAHRLGLIGDGDRDAFHVLRRMRNECAHDISTNDFNNPSFINRTIALVNGYEEILDAWWNHSKKHANVKEALQEIEINEKNSGWKKIKDLCGERQLFSFVAATMIWVVEDAQRNIAPLTYNFVENQ